MMLTHQECWAAMAVALSIISACTGVWIYRWGRFPKPSARWGAMSVPPETPSNSYTTAHPPSVAATCIAAFELLDEEPELVERLWANTRFFKEKLAHLGFNTGASETPITPIIVGDAALAHQFSRELFEAGVFAQGIGYPTVPVGKARLRTIVTATHTQEELIRALEILENIAKKLKIL